MGKSQKGRAVGGQGATAPTPGECIWSDLATGASPVKPTRDSPMTPSAA